MVPAATPPATGVRVIPLGIGDAFTALHYTTCMALGAGDDWLLIDCPHPIRKLLREGSYAAGSPLDLERIQGVALSHLHADHACGLEDFAYYSHFVLGRKARVAAHPDVLARMWDGLLTAGMGESRLDPAAPAVVKHREDYFDVTPLDEAHRVAFGSFQIECRRTIHPVPTTAMRISSLGRTLGFSADSAFDPGLIAWLEPCDLILHEVTTQLASLVHTPYNALASLPVPLRAKMRLFHYPDNFDVDHSAVEPLRQGRVYPV